MIYAFNTAGIDPVSFSVHMGHIGFWNIILNRTANVKMGPCNVTHSWVSSPELLLIARQSADSRLT